MAAKKKGDADATKALLVGVFQAMRAGAMMLPLEHGSIGISDQPCPGCGEKKLCVRWQGEALAVTCGRPPLGCGFLLVEQRN